MNIIELAKQAGIEDAHFHAPHPGAIAQLECFAALVEAATRADECEECAKVCDKLHRDWKWRAAEAIRARGNNMKITKDYTRKDGLRAITVVETVDALFELCKELREELETARAEIREHFGVEE